MSGLYANPNASQLTAAGRLWICIFHAHRHTDGRVSFNTFSTNRHPPQSVCVLTLSNVITCKWRSYYHPFAWSAIFFCGGETHFLRSACQPWISDRFCGRLRWLEAITTIFRWLTPKKPKARVEQSWKHHSRVKCKPNQLTSAKHGSLCHYSLVLIISSANNSRPTPRSRTLLMTPGTNQRASAKKNSKPPRHRKFP